MPIQNSFRQYAYHVRCAPDMDGSASERVRAKSPLKPLVAAVVLSFSAFSQTASALPRVSALRLASSLEHHAFAALPVTNCNDDGGDGTLRKAFASAVDGDVIDLSAVSCSIITLHNGQIADAATTKNVTIHSGGSISIIRDTPSPAANGRVIFHAGVGTLTLENVSVLYGNTNDVRGGGCIYSAGNVAFLGGKAAFCGVYTEFGGEARGGAIAAKGSVLLVGSSIRESSAKSATQANGGAIWARSVTLKKNDDAGSSIDRTHVISDTGNGGAIFSSGPTNIYYSSITHTDAPTSGGIFTVGPLTMSNSTVSYASATKPGGFSVGGIYAVDEVTIRSSTLTHNTGKYGGVVTTLDYSQSLIDSTIIAYSLKYDNATIGIDFASPKHTMVIGSNNIVVRASGAIPVDTIHQLPLLTPLRFERNVTRSQSPMQGSPASHHGSNASKFEFDQGGNTRGSGCSVDIGAIQETVFCGNFENPP
jgi:hypothetical protein